MIVQSVQCDNCGKIMKIDYDDYFELSGSIKRGVRYSLNSKDDSVSHICVNCFIKHFNLMVSTKREPLDIEKQGDILKRKIEDTGPYTPQKGEPIPYDKAVRYELPFEVTCTGDTKPISACEKRAPTGTKDDPYPNQVQRFPTDPSEEIEYPNQVQRFPTKNDPNPYNGRFN